ncbi:MAG: YerC/YecD family TrpR-related protein [bacterium]|nr:YerC/YecD family TrpR-related protein [bacterium]
MAKFGSRLPKEELEKYFYQLCVAISELKDSKEAAELLRDLLSYQEAEMIAKRLKIAEHLLGNSTYQEIQKKLKVAPATIARVQEWLKISGDGYQRAVNKIKNESTEVKNTTRDYSDWFSLKRRYPAYYWPQILLENIIETANLRQKNKIKGVLNQMEKMKEKSELFVKLKSLLNKGKIYH